MPSGMGNFAAATSATWMSTAGSTSWTEKNLIIASGYKVWPREVEDALYEHPAVREATVIGVKDEYRGESVKAFVSLKQEQTITGQELINHCREKLAAYKRPHAVTILNELPKNLSGKNLRIKLRDIDKL